jgi:hypothetical protein
LVVVDRDHFQELFDAPEDRLSFGQSLIRANHFDYGFNGNVLNSYHAEVIRNRLTQNIQAKMPDIIDEVNAGFEDELEPTITNGTVP